MKKLQLYLLALFMAAGIGGAAFATIPTPVSAADCSGRNIILTFPAWYRGLAESDGNGCKIRFPGTTQGNGGLTKFVWTIILNVIDMLLQLVGYVAVGFIIYGGFIFLSSAGAPDAAARARKMILNAVIGLILAITSVAIVNLIAGGLNI